MNFIGIDLSWRVSPPKNPKNTKENIKNVMGNTCVLEKIIKVESPWGMAGIEI
ncbi:MAG: hypothetical protein JSV56_01430 [Methanomassiliicoccales archaeon]|nr:MAG: hypothetical protein JSV56_01430 [Methanomassiliicoccales archaeon]